MGWGSMADNLMAEDASEDFDWVDRLAQALDDLVESITAVRINLPTLSNSEYRSLARQANQDANANLFFEEYLPKFDSYPAAAVAILQDHPVLRRESTVSAGKPAVMMLMPPGAASRVELDRLSLYLTKTAARKGGRHAAGILDEYLTLSETKTLPAQEITLFRGLQVERRFEIGEEAFIAPYGELVDGGLLRERKAFPEEDPADYRQLEVAGVVRGLTWGPGIRPPMTSTTPIGEGIPDVSFLCLGDREGLGVIVDFLSVLTRSELDILSVQYRAADFMEEIEPNFKNGVVTVLVEKSRLRPFMRTGQRLEDEHVDALRKSIRDWTRGDGLVGRALRRLTSSVARTGRFRLEDSILDLSIALEMMYSIDNEMTYKLGTRAGYFLGNDALERNRTFDIVRRLYGKRSDIVHGRQTVRAELEQISSEGLELARNTLLKLLRTEMTGERNQFWNNLVMTGGMPLETADPALAVRRELSEDGHSGTFC